EHIHKDPAESSTDLDVDAKGWRTTHNHWKQRKNKQEKNKIMKSDHKNETDIKHLVDSAKTSSRMCYQPNENESEDSVGQHSSITSKRKQRDIKQQKIETVQRNHNNGIEIIDLDDSPITSKRKQRDIKQQKIVTVQRNHNNGIELIDLDDSPIASSRVRDIPDAE
nr:hypothetical protein [Tanacetum cinerariifolium]